MRVIVAIIGFCLASLLAGLACAQVTNEPAAPGKRPKVYALLAAIGEQFSVVSEVSRTGSHLSPYQRRTSDIPNEILNRLALHGLDQAIAKIDPDSRRVYMALPAAQMDGVAPSERENLAIGRILAELQKMPQRADWDRIVIATPAYRAQSFNGLGSKLQGFGLFAQPLCQASCGAGFRPEDQARALTREPAEGVDAITSEDQAIKARTFIAPFSYIEVWVLDPKTLAVIDKQQGFDSQKLAEPPEKALDLSESAGQKYVAARISHLIELSVGAAVMRSEINGRHGTVELGNIKEVKPEDVKK